MATYAIGDVQGCYDELLALLDLVGFDEAADSLWFVGDLVNRGPKSLEVLRFVKSLGDRAVTVLGNHDLHLLAVAEGVKSVKKQSSLQAVLDASDRDELLDWLRHRKLMHHDRRLGFSMVHAGVAPQWDLAMALEMAASVEAVLQNSPACKAFLANMYGDKPDTWSDSLQDFDRLRFITNAFTRLRYCTKKGRLSMRAKGPLGSQPARYWPWFMIPGRQTANTRIVFGHWSTLGYMAGVNVWALDTGCLWGGHLTALRLEDRQPFFLNCRGELKPDAGAG
ncbi:MAG: symmetrical bis(5'-nucleosyl)-tetraphosphatase [Gammaproteobacteria bacterium]